MMMECPKDLLFKVLFTGPEGLVREIVADSQARLGAGWGPRELGGCSLCNLRCLFFLLLDRDDAMKDKIMGGWPASGIDGLPGSKAEAIFLRLRTEIIEPWLADERRTPDELLGRITDLYLVS